jgi:classical protein kinase C
MTMETANILLRDWRDINKARGDKAQPPRKQLSMAESPTAGMDRMKISAPESSVPVDPYGRPLPPTSDRYTPDPRYPQQQQQQQQQQLQHPYQQQPPPPQAQVPYASVPPPTRPPGGARTPVPPNYNEPPPPQGRPPPGAYDPSAVGPDGYPITYPVRLLANAIEG